MLLMAVISYVNYFYINGITDYALYYKLDIAEIFSALLIVPLFYFYFKALTCENAFGWRTYLMLLSGLLLGSVLTLLYIMMGDTQAAAYIREAVESGGNLQYHTALIHRVHYLLNTYVCQLFILVQAFGLIIYATVRIYRYRKRLGDFFSDVEENIAHHRAVLRGICALFVYMIFLLSGGYTLYDVQYSLPVLLIYLVFSGIIYYICYHVYYADYTIDSLVDELVQTDQEVSLGTEAVPCEKECEAGSGLESDPLCDYEQEEFQKNYFKILPDFVRLIEEDRIYLQKNLRLSDVAHEICTNRTYISQLLREEYQCSFFDFINRKRIEYAMELARNHPEFKQRQIAEECGFVHASVFSRAFKQYIGMTFREWQREFPVSEKNIPPYK